MLRYALFPTARWKSFLVIMIFFNLALFLFCCLFGLQDQGNLLQVQVETLRSFGANWPYRIYHNFEVYRWLSACFLHSDFMHIFFNSFTTLLLTHIEDIYGSKSTAIIYIFSGMIGNLFSSVLSDLNQISVGASTCIYGLFGCYIGFYILNWKGVDGYMQGDEKCLSISIIMLTTFLLVSSSLPIGTSSTHIDYRGHIGGLIGGILLSVIVPRPIVQGEYEKQAKFSCSVLLGLFVTLCLLFFYLVNFQ